MTTLPNATATKMVVGPVQVQSHCAFQSQVQPGVTTLRVPCAVSLTNVSGQTQYLVAQTTSQTARALPTLTEQTTVTFYPGQSLSLPHPATGQQWQIVIASRKSVRHLMGDLSDAVWVVLGLAAYGGYEIVKNRRAIGQRIKRMF